MADSIGGPYELTIDGVPYHIGDTVKHSKGGVERTLIESHSGANVYSEVEFPAYIEAKILFTKDVSLSDLASMGDVVAQLETPTRTLVLNGAFITTPPELDDDGTGTVRFTTARNNAVEVPKS